MSASVHHEAAQVLEDENRLGLRGIDDARNEPWRRWQDVKDVLTVTNTSVECPLIEDQSEDKICVPYANTIVIKEPPPPDECRYPKSPRHAMASPALTSKLTCFHCAMEMSFLDSRRWEPSRNTNQPVLGLRSLRATVTYTFPSPPLLTVVGSGFDS